jgi:hypothetical protein
MFRFISTTTSGSVDVQSADSFAAQDLMDLLVARMEQCDWWTTLVVVDPEGGIETIR